MKSKKRFNFFISLFITLATIGALVFCAYLTLDRFVVPKYFKEYGIENMHDLVSMVKTLYNSPDEKDIVTNGFTQADQRGAVKRLIDVGLPAIDDETLDYLTISEGLDRNDLALGTYYFKDREIASIIDQMLSSGVLTSKLPNIKYLDTINLNVLELIINPTEIETEEGTIYSDTSADVTFMFKLDTSAVRKQMASAMDTPLFLLNMIVPKTMFLSVNYHISQTDEGSWVINDGKLAVNGRTAKDSEILLNLLIEFIFPESDQMNIEKLSSEIGNILIQGVELIGNMRVHTFDDGSYGISIIL